MSDTDEDFPFKGPRIVTMAGALDLHALPGAPYVAHFGGFNVLVTHEGCALILPSNMRAGIAGMKPGEDRLITEWAKLGKPGDALPLGEVDEGVYARIVAESLEWAPKESVP